MSLQRFIHKLAVLAAAFVFAAGSAAVYADGCATCGTGGSCGPAGCCSQNGCCPCGPCPPPLIHCTPKVPKIKYKCTCGKPICDPCELEGYGFNPTCWRPWIPPLNCPGCGGPALGAPEPVPFPIGQMPVNQYQPSTTDQRQQPPQGSGDELPLPQKMPKDSNPANR